ncbi:MAG TPA: hypothetical protein DCM86_06825, partial [Verrucomicrobiales bacterium]|nr:hypothetical protein [Verrucomicrobiales bacterium]
MLFHTWPFLVFLLVVLPGFYALRGTRLWMPWLTAASYFFYGWWNPYYLILVVYSTALDFSLVALMDHCPRDPAPGELGSRRARVWGGDPLLRNAFVATLIAAAITLGGVPFAPASVRPSLVVLALLLSLMCLGAFRQSRRVWLFISLFNNLALLLFFKYAGFLVENLNGLLSWSHVGGRIPSPSTLMPFGAAYILPVGISFFTFQSMSYTIDFYLGKVGRERSFLRFATFVCFFPQLMAGPIERAAHLLPQFYEFPKIRTQDITDGLSLFLVGLFKKLALANYLSYYVERIYDQPKAYGAPALILGTVAFAWQIFFDFSGYTDMARGLA